jgi:hypothetical protein
MNELSIPNAAQTRNAQEDLPHARQKIQSHTRHDRYGHVNKLANKEKKDEQKGPLKRADLQPLNFIILNAVKDLLSAMSTTVIPASLGD